MGEISFTCTPENVRIRDDSITLRVSQTYIESIYATTLDNLNKDSGLHLWSEVEIGRIKWIVYGFCGEKDENEKFQIIKLISKSPVTEMTFGDDNNWFNSSVRQYLYQNTLSRVCGDVVDRGDIVPINIGLTALDGTKLRVVGGREESIAIPSFDEFRNDRLGMSTVDEDVLWTLTPWSCHGSEFKMCCIEQDETIGKADIHDCLAVHPIIWLRRNAKIRQEESDVKVDISW